MKFIKKVSVLVLCICMLAPMFGIQSHAASGSISISSATGNVGSTVSVTCTIKCTSGPIGIADVVLGYDTAKLKYESGSGGYSLIGGSGSVSYRGLTADGVANSLSFTMKFSIKQEGTSTIYVTSASVHDVDEIPFTPTYGSGTITGKTVNTGTGSGGNTSGGNTTQTKKDTNNQLKSLQVYPGSLTPSFSAGNTAYNMTVPSDVREVTISATPQSSKATVTVSGGKDLKLGINTAKVIVIAESGASRAYTITIMCGEEEKIQIDGKAYTIDEDFLDEQIPTGFSRTKITYNSREYEGLTNVTNNLYLMSLKNDTGATYYIYNQNSQEFHTFVQITIAEGKYIIPLPLGKEVKAFSKNETVSLTIQDKSFDAWKLDEEFSVAYVMNQNGENALYRYDSVDGVFQRYTDVELKVEDVETKPWFPSDYYMYAIIGLGTLCMILLISMIYFIASRKQRHEGRKKKALRRMEKRRIKEEKAAEKQRIADEKAAAKQRAIEEKEAEKQREIEERERAIEEKKRLKEEKKLARKKKKDE